MNRYNTLENRVEMRELVVDPKDIPAMRAKADTMMEKIIRNKYAKAVESGNAAMMQQAKELAELQGITL